MDVALGGGCANFLPEGPKGRRKDGQDLLAGIERRGAEMVWTKADLENASTYREKEIVGVFAPGPLAFSDEIESGSQQPSLSDMVRRAIQFLQINGNGYFAQSSMRVLLRKLRNGIRVSARLKKRWRSIGPSERRSARGRPIISRRCGAECDRWADTQWPSIAPDRGVSLLGHDRLGSSRVDMGHGTERSARGRAQGTRCLSDSCRLDDGRRRPPSRRRALAPKLFHGFLGEHSRLRIAALTPLAARLDDNAEEEQRGHVPSLMHHTRCVVFQTCAPSRSNRRSPRTGCSDHGIPATNTNGIRDEDGTLPRLDRDLESEHRHEVTMTGWNLYDGTTSWASRRSIFARRPHAHLGVREKSHRRHGTASYQLHAESSRRALCSYDA